MEAPATRQLDAHQLREVAVIARCDPRTVQRYLRGEQLWSIVAERIAGAIATLERQRRRGRVTTENGAR